ncbi:MAG: type III pantothenate kinase, partial [Elusimicrobiota bacterium]|nr:type III pantothenate kinase [Elusimicrobiota bacterium]
MLLVFDIGNTNITIGLFDLKEKNNLNPKKVWNMTSVKTQTADEYGIMLMNMFFYSGLDIKEVKYAAIASVVPSLNPVFEELIKNCINKNAFFAVNYQNSGIKFAVKNYKEVGADRIANTAAAWALFKGGLAVIDFGTATTFDCIDSKGRYIGGAITPGPNLAAAALNLRTAQLPQVEIKRPAKAIGTSTVECIQSGLYFGYIGLIKEIIARIKTEMKLNKIIVTGGLAGLMSSEIKEINSVCPDLTLQGIKII